MGHSHHPAILTKLQASFASIVSHRPVVAAESAELLVGGGGAARPAQQQSVAAPAHPVAVLRHNALLLLNEQEPRLCRQMGYNLSVDVKGVE